MGLCSRGPEHRDPGSDLPATARYAQNPAVTHAQLAGAGIVLSGLTASISLLETLTAVPALQMRRAWWSALTHLSSWAGHASTQRARAGWPNNGNQDVWRISEPPGMLRGVGTGTVPQVVSGTQDHKEASLPGMWTAVFSRVITRSSGRARLLSDLIFT